MIKLPMKATVFLVSITFPPMFSGLILHRSNVNAEHYFLFASEVISVRQEFQFLWLQRYVFLFTEKHKSYHQKDEILGRDGFKKFMKYEHCSFPGCRFSKISNHIHCIRPGKENEVHFIIFCNYIFFLSFRAIRPIRSDPISDFRDVWQTGGSNHSQVGRQSVAGNFPSKTGTHLHLSRVRK